MAYLLKGGILIAVLAVAIGVYFTVLAPYPKPPDMEDGWFGPGTQPKPDDQTIHKFKLQVSEDILTDLKNRIKGSRLTADLEAGTFDYGMQTKALKEILNYWQTKYNWRKQEGILNSFTQYKTQIEGLMVHFIHAKSKHANAKPLLMIHGWPGSVWEFYKVLPMLTDPTQHGGTEKDAFHVICPSIPGFGFSEKPHQKGFDVEAAARVFKKLMTRLGYNSFYLQGGDWGSFISTVIAQAYQKDIKGLHLNMVPPPLNSGMVFVKQMLASLWPPLVAEASETWKIKPLKEVYLQLLEETGYFHIQATKPDTVGVGLDDSPAALAAYILEKFSTFQHGGLEARSTASGGLTNNFSADELLTNVMIYWVTSTGKSAVRFYKELMHGRGVRKDGWDLVPVTVPTGIANFPYEAQPALRSVAAIKYHNIIHFEDLPQGGHFAALEQPKLLAEDVRSFVQKLDKNTSQR